MMISYIPILGYGGGSVAEEGAGTEAQNWVIRSQRQHVNIDPSVSEGAEMTLPFVWYTDYVDLTNVAVDSLLMGTFMMNEISPLKSLSDVTGATPPSVTIRVYGHVQNIELVGNTSMTQGIIPQSGCNSQLEQEEADRGKVSSTLTTLSGVAQQLSTIPGFAPYALPSSMALTAGSKLAKTLGFCKPLNLTDVVRYQPRAMDMMTHGIGADTCVKLALDPQQITTVDPEVLGSDKDELSFSSIITRYSFIKGQVWSLSDTFGDLLHAYDVTPKQCLINNGAAATTALGGVAQLFQYWCGSITYRFDIISTAFHRGRLLVVYDPLGSVGTPEEVVQYAAVVDISEARSFTVTIKYNSNYGMLPVGPLNAENRGSSTPKTAEPHSNGMLSLYVANPLSVPKQEPGTPTDINILAYVKGENDMLFTLPRPVHNTNGKNIYFPNSGVDEQLLRGSDTSAPLEVLNIGIRDISGTPSTYAGESIQSFRTLLKRYNHYYTESIPDTFDLNNCFYTFKHGAYPASPGYSLTGVPVNPSGVALNPNNDVGFNYISYVKMAFVTIRGSVRWKYIPLSGSPLGYTIVTRERVESGDLFQRSTLYFSEASLPNVASIKMADTLSGYALTSNKVNNVLEFEMPYQSTVKFYVGRSDDNATKAMSFDNEAFNIITLGSVAPDIFSLYVSAGEDFTASHFVGWPIYQMDQY